MTYCLNKQSVIMAQAYHGFLLTCTHACHLISPLNASIFCLLLYIRNGALCNAILASDCR